MTERHRADIILENRTRERVKVKDNSKKVKFVAYVVVNAIKSKNKLGVGYKPKRKFAVKQQKTGLWRQNIKQKINLNKIVAEFFCAPARREEYCRSYQFLLICQL